MLFGISKFWFFTCEQKKVERKFVIHRFVWPKMCSGGKSSLVIDSFRCVQVRFHTKTMKKLVFFTKCPLMTGFRCGQSPLWTGFTVIEIFHYEPFLLSIFLMFAVSKYWNLIFSHFHSHFEWKSHTLLIKGYVMHTDNFDSKIDQPHSKWGCHDILLK
jgi:hypothetical protein